MAGVAAVTVPSAAVVVLLTQRLRSLEVKPARDGGDIRYAGLGARHDGNRCMAAGAAALERAKVASYRGHPGRIARVIAAVRGLPIQVLMLAALIGWFWQAPAEQ